MSGHQITPDDIAALRAEGNLTAYINALTGRTPKPAVQAASDPVFVPGPLHRPGAWPAGTRTDAPTCHPDCTCAITTRPARPVADTAA